MITVYLVESFLVLLTAAAAFFLLGTSFGWVMWGRFKKMLVEWKSNAERLNKRIAHLEEEADRAQIIRHELETEKKEVLEIFAKRKREMADFEADASEVEAELRETHAKLEASERLAAETEAARHEWESKAAKLDARIEQRTKVIDALNERIETIQRERDAEIGILKTKLLASEQEEHSKVKDLTMRVAAGNRAAPAKAKKQPRYDSRSGDAVAKPKTGRRGRKPKESSEGPQMDLGLKS